MIYAGYHLQSSLLEPWLRTAAAASVGAFGLAARTGSPWWLHMGAELEMLALTEVTHRRPDFGVERVVDPEGRLVPVACDVSTATPFCRLLHFRRAAPVPLPRVLLVAPMSGHFATLLAGTLRTLLQDHEVFVTDWINARDIPPAAGRFGFAEYVGHLVGFMHHLGPPVHLMGVCQPTVACLAATALMAEDGDAAQPASVVLLAGPIDTRLSPTRVNQLAKDRPIEWFERQLTQVVPFPLKGAGRRVYPGFVQLLAFMGMNSERHVQSFLAMRRHRLAGDDARADAIRDFYREYFAVMDLPAEFYLETVKSVFQDHDLPQGRLMVGDRRVDCAAVRRPFLLTVEGERDDICGIGQTLAAQDLCRRMPVYRKGHLLQAGVGHYGVFNGKRWERRIYPAVREFIASAH